MFEIDEKDWRTDTSTLNDWYAKRNQEKLNVKSFKNQIKAFNHADIKLSHGCIELGKYIISLRSDKKIMVRYTNYDASYESFIFEICFNYLKNLKIDTDGGMLIINDKVCFKYK